MCNFKFSLLSFLKNLMKSLKTNGSDRRSVLTAIIPTCLCCRAVYPNIEIRNFNYLQEEDEDAYKRQFSQFIKKGVSADSVRF